jgi:membrane dipeptidase
MACLGRPSTPGCSNPVGSAAKPSGGFGKEQTPADVDTIVDLQKLPPLLERRGYSAADIALIMHGNWLRLFGEALPDAAADR